MQMPLLTQYGQVRMQRQTLILCLIIIGEVIELFTEIENFIQEFDFD